MKKTLTAVILGILSSYAVVLTAYASVTYNWENNAYAQTAATSATVSKGDNAISQKDLLLAVVCAANSTTDPGTISSPGWTGQAGEWVKPSDGAGVRCWVATKIAGANEPVNYTFSWKNSNIFSWVLLDYGPVNTSNPIDGSVGDTQHTSGYTGSIVAPSISPSGKDSTLISLWTFPASGTTNCGKGCSVTMRVNQHATTTTSPWIGVGDLQLNAAGETETQTITYQYSVQAYQAISLALQPSSPEK